MKEYGLVKSRIQNRKWSDSGTNEYKVTILFWFLFYSKIKWITYL